MDEDSFDWLLFDCNERFGANRIRTYIKKNPTDELLEFKRCMEISLQPIDIERNTDGPSPMSADEIADVASQGNVKRLDWGRFCRKAMESEKEKLIKILSEEKNPDKKAAILSMMTDRPSEIPLDPKEMVGYAKSDHQGLSEAAIQVLTRLYGDAVRDFGKELLASDTHRHEAIRMLLRNYRKEDKDLLLSVIGALPIDYEDSSSWHRISLTILSDTDYGLTLPKEFFLWIYENSLCSCCREYAVRTLGKRRWLTDDLIRECAYDSNLDIRSYVKRYYKGVIEGK
ncbi:MAG: hypothetical protein ACI3XR_08485 [Eubacteriales bacterium]